MRIWFYSEKAERGDDPNVEYIDASDFGLVLEMLCSYCWLI